MILDDFINTMANYRLFAESELRSIRAENDTLTKIYSKEGISIWRVICGDKSMILKCFHEPEHRREIRNYNIMSSLGIPTLKIIAHTECALIMEDIEQSVYRLGTESDLNNPKTVELTAKWYRTLHEQGRKYTQKHLLYDECDVITPENIEEIKSKTDTGDLPVWWEINKNFELIKSAVTNLPRTLTYNDFYYTNLAAARNNNAALMFDYNLLGKGYVYSDIRNVCTSLGKDVKAAFMSAYGDFDKSEITVDNVASVLTTLHFACRREKFPSWAVGELEKVKNGVLIEAIHVLLGG